MAISHISEVLQTANSAIGKQAKTQQTVMADFQSILDEAQNSEDAAAAYENFMSGPEHPFKNVAYIAESVTFPPADAPPDFLLAWDKTLNSLPEVQRVLLTADILDTLEFGDYWGEQVSDMQRGINVTNRLNELGYRGLMELAVHSIEHKLRDNIEFGNELIYINNIRDSLRNCQGMLALYDSLTSHK